MHGVSGLRDLNDIVLLLCNLMDSQLSHDLPMIFPLTVPCFLGKSSRSYGKVGKAFSIFLEAFLGRSWESPGKLWEGPGKKGLSSE